VVYSSSTHLAGWQGRLLYDPVPKHCPKYLFAAGTRKARLLYGMPQALKATGPVAIVEGITDV
jgi:hypothetical protein